MELKTRPLCSARRFCNEEQCTHRYIHTLAGRCFLYIQTHYVQEMPEKGARFWGVERWHICILHLRWSYWGLEARVVSSTFPLFPLKAHDS